MEETFGARLDALMRRNPIYRSRGGQTSLSRATGVSQPTINRILSDKSVPETETVRKLAKEFRVSVEWLLTGKGIRDIRDFDFDPNWEDEGRDQRPESRTAEAVSPTAFRTVFGDAPGYVFAALAAVWDAYLAGAPEDSFKAVETLMRPLKSAKNAGTISPPKREKAAGTSPKHDPVVEQAREMRKKARGVPTRSEGSREGEVEQKKRAKGS